MSRHSLALFLLVSCLLNGEVRAMDPDRSAGTLVRDNNSFALHLYARVKEGEGNRFLSPFSISSALAMTYAGAQEETAEQMAKTLHFTLPPGELHPAFHTLIAQLNSQTATPAGT